MKKIRLLTSLMVLTLVLAGCDGTEPDDSTGSYDVNARFVASLNKDKGYYDIPLKYDDALFLNDAKVYNKDLAELSFGAAVTASTKEITTKFYEDCHFSDVLAAHYEETPTALSVAYTLAHKTIEDYELVALSSRWFDYRKEWENNFVIGSEGDHEGFSNRSNEVYTALESYATTYAQNRPIKLWITGYSRGGAIANVLSSLILRDNRMSIEQSNMFTYTFDAPNGLSEEHAIRYENVHNIVNSGDLITNFAPNVYGLKRCGIDHEIYNLDVHNIVKTFDEGIDIPEFIETDLNNHQYESVTVHNDIELMNFLLDYAFTVEGSESVLANTRAQYVANFQTAISTTIGLIFSLSTTTLDELVADLSAKAGNISEILAIISSPESMANYLETFLDKDNVPYDADALPGYMEKLLNLAFVQFNPVLSMVVKGTGSDASRLITVHYPEVIYSLLKNYHASI